MSKMNVFGRQKRRFLDCAQLEVGPISPHFCSAWMTKGEPPSEKHSIRNSFKIIPTPPGGPPLNLRDPLSDFTVSEKHPIRNSFGIIPMAPMGPKGAEGALPQGARRAPWPLSLGPGGPSLGSLVPPWGPPWFARNNKHCACTCKARWVGLLGSRAHAV